MQNLLCLDMAAAVGAVVPNAFGTWLAGAALPALVGLIATPLMLYQLSPPELKSTPEAPLEAEAKLQAMGPMTLNEKYMLGTMALAVFLWVSWMRRWERR